jgi:hypothetical protein
VVWRSEGSYCGWAPLPPRAEFVAGFGWRFNGVRVGVNFDFGLRPDYYTFVSLGDFDRHDLGHRRLQQTEVTRIYNHTTVINNYVVNNNTIVNQGIQVARVRSATRTPMTKLALRDVPSGSPEVRGVRAGRNEVAVYRPELRAPARPVKMVAQKVDDRHPVIQHEPLPAANVQRRAVPAGNVSAPATGPRGMKSESPRTSPQPATDRAVPAIPRPQNYSAPRGSQMAPVAPRVSEPPSPTARSTAPVAPARLPSAAKPDEPGHLYPLRTRESAQPESASPRQTPQYQPKGYHQAAEAHSLPPLPKVRQQDTFSPLPPTPPGGKPRKNEQ